jgi:uridylate kinase
LCKESSMPIIVFNMDTGGNLERIVQGDSVGTLVHWEATENTEAAPVTV